MTDATADAEIDERTGAGRVADRALRLSEDLVYTLACALLVAGALALLAKAAWDLATHLDEGVLTTVTGVLNELLLVFILIELLGAVRETLRKRRLVAEPFVLVGIIATVKELVVTSAAASESRGTPEFDDAATQIGVLAGLIVALAVASFLLRRKEREPSEAE